MKMAPFTGFNYEKSINIKALCMFKAQSYKAAIFSLCKIEKIKH